MRLCCNTALSIRLKSQGWLSEAISGGQPARQPRVKLVEIFKVLAAKCPLWVKSRHRLSAVERPLSAKIGNQTDRLAHSPGKPPGELAGRFETRTAPMVTWGGDADPAGALPG